MGCKDSVNPDRQTYIFKVADGEHLTIPSQIPTYNCKISYTIDFYQRLYRLFTFVLYCENGH